MRRRGWRWGLLAMLLLAPSTVAASEGVPSRVVVKLPSCAVVPFERGALLELLAIELRADGIERVDEGDAQAVATLHIEQPGCEGQRVTLVLEDRATSKTVGRGVDLGSLEESARARFLALSAAELMRASWLELLVLRPSAQDTLSRSVRARVHEFVTPRPPPLSAAPAPAAPLSGRASVFAGAVVRGYPAAQSGLLGGMIGGQFWWGRQALRLDLRVQGGESFDALGQVSLTQATASGAWLLATAPGAVRLAVGPRVEVGAGQAKGTAGVAGVTASSGRHAVASGAALGLLSGAIGERLEAFAALEAGVTFVGFSAHADDRKIGGVRGPFVETSVGLALLYLATCDP